MLQGTQDGVDHQYQQDYNGTLRIAGKHGDRCRNDQDYYQQISKLTDKYFRYTFAPALLQDIFTLFQAKLLRAGSSKPLFCHLIFFHEFFYRNIPDVFLCHIQILLLK